MNLSLTSSDTSKSHSWSNISIHDTAVGDLLQAELQVFATMNLVAATIYSFVTSVGFLFMMMIGGIIIYYAAALHFLHYSPQDALSPVLARMPEWHTLLMDSYVTSTFTLPVCFSLIGLFLLNLGIGYFGECHIDY